MKKKNRLWSLALSLCMAASLLPFAAAPIHAENGSGAIAPGGILASAGTMIPVSAGSNSISVGVKTDGKAAILGSFGENDVKRVTNQAAGPIVLDATGLRSYVREIKLTDEGFSSVTNVVNKESSGITALTVHLTDGSLTLDGKALASVPARESSDMVALYLADIGYGKLMPEQQAAVAELDVLAAYDIHMTAGFVRLSSLGGGKATISVPAGEEAKGASVWYVSTSGETTKIPGSWADGVYTWSVDHFSNYVLARGTEPVQETEPAQETEPVQVTEPAQETEPVQEATPCPRDATCPISAFTDMDPAAWYHDGVHYALESGLMGGMGGGKFAPDGTVSRAMIMTMFWRLAGSPAVSAETEYADVAEQAWYAAAVRWAGAEGIISGYRDETGRLLFGPDVPVTREQLAGLFYRLAQSQGLGFTGAWDFPLDYPDAADAAEWAHESLCWATMHGILGGIDGRLAPKGNASRAQVATMFLRYQTETAK